MIFFSKCSKFYVYFENSKEIGEHVHGFEDNCVWTYCESFCQLWQEYMWSAVNLLKKCSKISDPTKRHDEQLHLFDINGTVA